jgi:hypothetical protein
MAAMVKSRLAFLTLPIATASLALAACGGGDSSTAASSDDQRSKFREAAVDFAECMREQGIDMKDPEPGGGIMLQAGPGSNDPAKVEAAQQACQKHLENARPPELSDEEEREFKERVLKFAQCMRDHGIDMPDPTFGEDGRVQMRMGEGEGGGLGMDRENPRFQEAQGACEQYSPRMQRQE